MGTPTLAMSTQFKVFGCLQWLASSCPTGAWASTMGVPSHALSRCMGYRSLQSFVLKVKLWVVDWSLTCCIVPVTQVCGMSTDGAGTVIRAPKHCFVAAYSQIPSVPLKMRDSNIIYIACAMMHYLHPSVYNGRWKLLTN